MVGDLFVGQRRMRVPQRVCRNGHLMAGENLLWHTRYEASGKRFWVRECRICANERYRVKRRNRRLDREALAALPDLVHVQPQRGDPLPDPVR